MSVANSIPRRLPTQPTEQELVYEWFRDQYWTETAYLALAESSNHLIELSDGRLVILPMPTSRHQRILKHFVAKASAYVDDHGLGEVLFAPHPIRLWPGKYREPDAMIWLDEHRDRIGERESGPPDLVLEILSPSNEPLDSDTKFREYAQAGIIEYWMIQPQSRQVSVFRLADQAYSLLGHFGEGDRAASAVLPGLEIAVDDLFPSE